MQVAKLLLNKGFDTQIRNNYGKYHCNIPGNDYSIPAD